ncbi:MAG: CRISPR-associated endonuclease Cas1 [Steroidobacteraceae bacterium]
MIVAGGSGYVADQKLAAAQRAARASKRQTMSISRWLVAEKIAKSCDTLTHVMQPSPARVRALQELTASAREMQTRPPKTMDGLRGIEGRVAQAYFTAWRSMPLRWKGMARKPVPEEWHRIGPRVAPNSKSNRGATHPANAMLNYGYAVLESQVQIAVVCAGLDPTIGYMHAQHAERSALVLDVMEPLRPVVDRAVLGLVHAQPVSTADFILRDDGVCRLTPQLARTIAAKSAESAEVGVDDLIGRLDRPNTNQKKSQGR